MAYKPIKCWSAPTEFIKPDALQEVPHTFRIMKKSILKSGFRGFLMEEREEIEQSEWYRDFLLGYEARFYIDGSGLYKIANLDLSENEIYFQRLSLPVGYEPWIFYSWQSDFPETRDEIRQALVELVDDINRTKNPRQELEVINDGDEERGSHSILEDLKKRIDQSMVVICDITNVAKVDGRKKEKWHPNANVIFEMSYAMIKKRAEQVILIKRERPDIKDDGVPFDFFQNRHLRYQPGDQLKDLLEPKLQYSLTKAGLIVDWAVK